MGAEPAAPQGLGSAADGIPTDERGGTAIPNVFACGDVARSRHPLLRRSIRVEHWTEAAAQGAAVADAILGLEPRNGELPFFWSDQFGLRLQYVGHAPEWSSVVLDGSPEAFSALYLDGSGRPLAGLVANRADELGGLRQRLGDTLPSGGIGLSRCAPFLLVALGLAAAAAAGNRPQPRPARADLPSGRAGREPQPDRPGRGHAEAGAEGTAARGRAG